MMHVYDGDISIGRLQFSRQIVSASTCYAVNWQQS